MDGQRLALRRSDQVTFTDAERGSGMYLGGVESTLRELETLLDASTSRIGPRQSAAWETRRPRAAIYTPNRTSHAESYISSKVG